MDSISPEARHISTDHEPDHSELVSAVYDYLPTLKQGVGILVENDSSHRQTEANVLRGHVCGRVARLLGYHLRSLGYDAATYRTHGLGDDYPTQDHAVLIVKDGGEDVIVDGAYLQFLAPLFLGADMTPSDEVLIMPTSRVSDVAEKFVALRKERLARHPRPEVLSHEMLYAMSDQELKEYFMHIWQVGAYHLAEHVLEDDIGSYMKDPSLVSPLTKKMIENLGLVAVR